jgi:energy-coupling factor transporter ATP-binding protein EcfA2
VTSLHAVDQSPAAAHRRSLVATFLGIAEVLRNAFAATPEARRLGLLPRDFSTNAGRGRCQRCMGLGTVEDGGPCPVCGGLRFGFDVLSVRVGGSNLVELFDAPVARLASSVLSAALLDAPLLRRMDELGIGYLSLGRSLDTLSGGEIQRLRIARALAHPEAAGALFVLDEPAGGLHPRDVERLHRALRHMVADGANTVVLVEHDPLLLAACDHIVEFGPGGGPAGGRVVASDRPDVVRSLDTPTGRALGAIVEPPLPSSSGGVATPARAAATRADALRARAEIRQILGDDVEVPDETNADEPTVPVALAAVTTEARRPRELAGLDHEIAKVLLDAAVPDVDAGLRELAVAWGRTDALRLQIHPMLDAMVTWGPRVPRSVAAEAHTHLAAMGLHLVVEREQDVRAIRATGQRFQPTTPSPGARLAAVRDAFVLGGGYVELADARGRVSAQFNARLMDLDRGLVGPRQPTPPAPTPKRSTRPLCDVPRRGRRDDAGRGAAHPKPTRDDCGRCVPGPASCGDP